ncbi:MAG TPA: formylglycine-generating enzyme family protein [Verrucomicrobiae bacterium]
MKKTIVYRGTAGALLGLSLVLLAGCGEAAKKPESANGASKAEPNPSDMSWTNGMVWIPAGTFSMGSENGQSDEKPVRQITVDGFWMDKTEVTNEEYEKFVKATGYVTIAERKPDPKDFPGADPAMLVAGSIVFRPPEGDVPLDNYYVWWTYIPGANWKHPEGPSSNLQGREKHPVVHVCYEDALAYCKWARKRLPTEAEWEYAARGGLDQKKYAWGDEQTPAGKWVANIWQGKFPAVNSMDDGFRTTSPVGTFPPNGYGLVDMAGNVWEWCADWYGADAYAKMPEKNPHGVSQEQSFDQNEPGVAKRVQRGGSYLCADTYCTGYRPSARMKNTPDSATSHSGFRCARTK